MSSPNEHVGKRITNVANRLRRYLDNETSRHGVTRVQAMILRFLLQNGGSPVYQRDIEREFGIRRSTVTNVLQLMEKNGLICRFCDEKDARMKRITITENGISANARVKGTVNGLEASLLSSLNADKKQQLFELLEIVENTLIELESQGKDGAVNDQTAFKVH